MRDNEPCILSVADMMRESLIRLRTDMVFERPQEARDFIMETFANGRLGYNDMSDDEIAMEYDDWFEGRSNPYFPELDELAKEDADD